MTVSHLMQLMRSTWEGHHHVCLGRRVNSHQLQRACQIAGTRRARTGQGLLHFISCTGHPHALVSTTTQHRSLSSSPVTDRSTTGIGRTAASVASARHPCAQTFCLSVAVHLHRAGHALHSCLAVDRWTTTLQAPIDALHSCITLHACVGSATHHLQLRI